MKKIQGTTLFIGSTPLDTDYGEFNVFIFQDIIDKKYVFALVYKELDKNKEIYIRMHSSCLTSETFLSMDCDCVFQLNDALEKVAEKKNGILFYLLQSGRGASYVSKSRDRQMVQYENDEITTFEAYERLGLLHDYRDYRNVRDITIIMDIFDKEFFLITNNPDKIKKITNLGITVKGIISVKTPDNPFNRKYLKSKLKSGHKLVLLNNNLNKLIDRQEQPSVKPFEPYHLENLKRFIHVASYFLPISPINDLIIVEEQPLEGYYEKTKDNKFLKKSNQAIPYWFKIDVYYDIAFHGEIMVLTYGNVAEINPIIRIHSERVYLK